MNKREIFEKLLIRVTDMLESAEVSREEAQHDANHHKGAMESRYDTFKEESQYLAGAQQKRIYELKNMQHMLSEILGNNGIFSAMTEKAQAASIVTLADENDVKTCYLLSPALGGEKFTVDGRTVTVLTLTSPLGLQVKSRRVGDEVVVMLQGKEKVYVVENIE